MPLPISTSDMTIYAEDGTSITRDTAALNITGESQTVDEIAVPSADNEKDIGQMSMDELNDYFNNEVGPQFEEWMTENFGAPSGF